MDRDNSLSDSGMDGDGQFEFFRRPDRASAPEGLDGYQAVGGLADDRPFQPTLKSVSQPDADTAPINTARFIRRTGPAHRARDDTPTQSITVVSRATGAPLARWDVPAPVGPPEPKDHASGARGTAPDRIDRSGSVRPGPPGGHPVQDRATARYDVAPARRAESPQQPESDPGWQLPPSLLVPGWQESVIDSKYYRDTDPHGISPIVAEEEEPEWTFLDSLIIALMFGCAIWGFWLAFYFWSVR